MSLERFLSELAALRVNRSECAHGGAGRETDWLHLGDLPLPSGHLQMGDATYIPSLEGDLFESLMPIGRYRVEVKVLDYGGDEQRISRLRVLMYGAFEPSPGEWIGSTWTDTAAIGLCDYKAYAAACGEDIERAWAAYDRVQQQMGLYGTVVLDEAKGAVMPVVFSGFGDGTYHVYALDAADGFVGVEVEFIPVGTPYPF